MLNKEYLLRLGVFVGVALVTMLLDLGTKEWAKANLARFDHPLPLKVDASLDGKTVKDLLESNGFGDAKASSLRRLAPPMEVSPADEFRPLDRLTAGEEAYYLFLDESREAAPVLIVNPARQGLIDAQSESAREAWRQEWSQRVMTWPEVIHAAKRYIDEDEAAALIEKGLLHPALFRGGFSGGRTVNDGDTYLLTEYTIEVIPGFMQFIYAENPGAAWGFLGDAPLWVRKVALQLLTLFAMVMMVVVAMRMPKTVGHWGAVSSLALIMGGALGNFVERIGKHFVVDFIDMYVKDSHWPTYNVADIAISVGVGILILQMLLKRSPFQEEKKAEPSD